MAPIFVIDKKPHYGTFVIIRPMTQGKLIFVSGLTGAGKTTLVGKALGGIENLEVLLTYTTRPKRAGEESSYEYVFVNDEGYDAAKNQSSNWDETIYKGYRYASDAAKFIKDLENGVNVIVAVTPSLEDMQAMERIYKTRPTTIWINTDPITAASRVNKDKTRAQRSEDESVKYKFDVIFEPTGQLDHDAKRFISLVNGIISGKDTLVSR